MCEFYYLRFLFLPELNLFFTQHPYVHLIYSHLLFGEEDNHIITQNTQYNLQANKKEKY